LDLIGPIIACFEEANVIDKFIRHLDEEGPEVVRAR